MKCKITKTRQCARHLTGYIECQVAGKCLGRADKEPAKAVTATPAGKGEQG